MLDEGKSDTRLAAQVAAQYALEERLQRAGLQRVNSAPYKWKEQVEALEDPNAYNYLTC
jgi:hypothetical protein